MFSLHINLLFFLYVLIYFYVLIFFKCALWIFFPLAVVMVTRLSLATISFLYKGLFLLFMPFTAVYTISPSQYLLGAALFKFSLVFLASMFRLIIPLKSLLIFERMFKRFW